MNPPRGDDCKCCMQLRVSLERIKVNSHEKVDQHTARVSRKLNDLGGELEVSLLVQRVCQ